MARLKLDDCVHCAAVTFVTGYTKEEAIEALERKELGCWNCCEEWEGDSEGHKNCVVLYEDNTVIWDGRCLK